MSVHTLSLKVMEHWFIQKCLRCWFTSPLGVGILWAKMQRSGPGPFRAYLATSHKLYTTWWSCLTLTQQDTLHSLLYNNQSDTAKVVFLFKSGSKRHARFPYILLQLLLKH